MKQERIFHRVNVNFQYVKLVVSKTALSETRPGACFKCPK